MLRIQDNNNNNRRNAEWTRTRRDDDPGTRLFGIPNAPPLLNLRPDHVAVGSPLSTRLSPPTPFSNNGSRFSAGDCGGGSPYSAQFRGGDHCSANAKLWLDSESSSFQVGKSTFSDNKWVDDLGGAVSNNFARMSIVDGTKPRGSYDVDGYNNACSLDSNVPFFNETGAPYCNGGVSVSPGFVGKGYAFEPSPLVHDHHHLYHHLTDQRVMKQGTSDQVQLQKPSSFVNPYVCDNPFLGSQHFGVDCEPASGWGAKNPFRFSQVMHPRIGLSPSVNTPSHFLPATRDMAMAVAAANGAELPQCLTPMRNGTNPAGFRCDNSIIIQGKDVKPFVERGYGSLRGCKKGQGPCGELAIQVVGENVSRHISNHAPGGSQICGNNSNFARDSSLPLMLDFYNLAQAKGYIYNMAKDQNGCRFLQRMVEEGTYEDVRVVFEGIVDNVVELMMDPFGNYLVQKLLDVCTEEQRFQIVLMLTKEQGQLVRISLNTHGYVCPPNLTINLIILLLIG